MGRVVYTRVQTNSPGTNNPDGTDKRLHMIIKATVTALALTLVPAMALARGDCGAREHQAQSCATGSVWDAASSSCVKQVTG